MFIELIPQLKRDLEKTYLKNIKKFIYLSKMTWTSLFPYMSQVTRSHAVSSIVKLGYLETPSIRTVAHTGGAWIALLTLKNVNKGTYAVRILVYNYYLPFYTRIIQILRCSRGSLLEINTCTTCRFTLHAFDVVNVENKLSSSLASITTFLLFTVNSGIIMILIYPIYSQ